ncbi:hypothetical protein D1007_54092 [Hordeum vulgare]|nr:hypothetical protein D1007_54092 [Hordeum vulgare]
MPGVAAFVGGYAKLWVVCRPMEVGDTATVMEDTQVTHGESMSLVVLDVLRRTRGMLVMAAFVGGCVKLRAMSGPMEVCVVAAVMTDTETVQGESVMSTADVEAEGAQLRCAVSAWQ